MALVFHLPNIQMLKIFTVFKNVIVTSLPVTGTHFLSIYA